MNQNQDFKESTKSKGNRQITRRKVRVIGRETYINRRTGEMEDFHLVSIEDRDANFHKIWLEHIIMSLDIIGNQKMRFAFWLLEHMTRDNNILMTQRQMAEKSGYSIETVKRVIKSLGESNFLRRANLGVYQINPTLLFKGGSTHRMNVVLQYDTMPSKQKDNIQDNADNWGND